MRIANPKDLPRIVDIYNSTIAGRKATADTQAVTVEQRQGWFDRHNPDRRPLLVEEDKGRVIGWLGFEDFYGRPAYGATAELSIYLDPAYRGTGLGSRMLQEAIDRAPSLGLHNLVAFVFSHNAESIRLFEKFGFQTWGELPDVACMDEREYSLTILGLRVSAA
ncbi:GNAT family N-acetyltransferase [Marinobacter oulmenensis]|uniref:Phosphinothricin acetyltransferase n=1 Tax=Marinobacter oulmenensis TaxID=643747 RepID=A0A840U9G9_9GAMM|nr:GNAT family N-acetyltransferase [Marinobacter oulmenensis]MBB5321632.1 phosphinothricin acetyltransferase [Marinobacter oulmenensis]